MKNLIFKSLALSLLIIPCAVLLTACGGVNLKSIFKKKSDNSSSDETVKVVDSRTRANDFFYSENYTNTDGFTYDIQSSGYYEITIYASYPLQADITRTLSINNKVVLQSNPQGSADSKLFYCIISAKKGDKLSLNKGKAIPDAEVADNYVSMQHIPSDKVSDVAIDLKNETQISSLYMTNYYYEGFSCELPLNGYYHIRAEIYYNGYRFDKPDTRYLKLNGKTVYERTIEVGNYPAVTIVDCYILTKQGDMLTLSEGINLKYQYHVNISFIPAVA